MNKKDFTKEKIIESCRSVLPISGIVFVLCLFFIPVSSGLMLSFLIGSALIIVGMAIFTIGADISMSQIGSHIGSKITASRNIFLILSVSLILGIAITVAEPDLQVLSSNAPSITGWVLILTVALGVGIFLMLSMVRILLGIPLKWMLLISYALIFILAAFADKDFLAIAFDAGGVTTGPMTVPFIMALGVGVASIRSDENAKSDSFGLVALCSIGPILAVLILSFFYGTEGSSAEVVNVLDFPTSVSLGLGFLKAFPKYMLEMVKALLPIFAFFIVFQVISLKLAGKTVHKILVGIVYTFIGLVLFLTGVNVGFSSLGFVLGEVLQSSKYSFVVVPLAAVMGWFIINAEPAVHVLNKQVNEISAGAISEKAMGYTLSIAVALAMGLAMLRVQTGISIMWFMVPGYMIALILTLVVPPTFTAIAFDAGGVASGPLTATFMLPFAMGVCTANGGNLVTDAFGLVAMTAMMPLITVQVMGAISLVKTNAEKARTAQDMQVLHGDNEIIELWEM